MFLTELRAEEELDCLLRPVAVCASSELDQQPQGDVFLCDHQYHTGCAVSPPAPQSYASMSLTQPAMLSTTADSGKQLRDDTRAGACRTCTGCAPRHALQGDSDGEREQVFRELDAPHEDRGDPLLLDEDGSQSESEEPAFSPAASSKHARGGRRRCLQVRRDREPHEVVKQLLPSMPWRACLQDTWSAPWQPCLPSTLQYGSAQGLKAVPAAAHIRILALIISSAFAALLAEEPMWIGMVHQRMRGEGRLILQREPVLGHHVMISDLGSHCDLC